MRTISALIFSVFILVSGFGLNACQRSDSVEAARETNTIDNPQHMLTEVDKDFVRYASEMHVGEIEMAQQAKRKTSNKDVADYADAVINGHSEALKQLSSAMRQTADAQPSMTASLDTQRHTEFLAPLSGADFDRQFIDLMIADHRDARDTFRAQLNVARSTELKNYVQEAVPNLENRLREAEDIQKKLRGL